LGDERMRQVTAMVHTSMLPRVSCLTLTYNRFPGASHLLSESVESFLRQDYPNKELIVVNDCPSQTIIFKHDNVKIINITKRFDTLGEKFNFAVANSSGGLLMIMDDDDIGLPWHIRMAVDRLGTNEYWQPDSHWILDNGSMKFVDMRGQLPAKGIFTRNLFDAIGGFAKSSESIDRDFQARAMKYAGSKAVREPIRAEECSYVYRWGGTGSYHHTSRDPGKYERVGRYPIKPCSVKLSPYWAVDYEEMVINAISVEKQA
jgi:glycosyltransferase involved in cell wall biosynthesis